MLYNSTMVAKWVTESSWSKRTQAGIDISVKQIEKVLEVADTMHQIYKDKTVLLPDAYYLLEPKQYLDHLGWRLYPGVYSCTFNEGVEIPPKAQGKITHRSSIYRIGNTIESPWWDAGFKCDFINSIMIVKNAMFVEMNARLAQIVFHELYEPEELYNGQWQGLSGANHK